MKIRTLLAVRACSGALLIATLASCVTAKQIEPVLPQASASAAAPALAATRAPATTPAAAKPSLPLPVLVSVDLQPDGTHRVRDLGNSYEFTLAPEWTAIPVTPEQIARLAQTSPAPDAEFLALARKLGDQQTDAFRLVGVRSDSALPQGSNPPLLLVTAIPDRLSAALPALELARMIQDTVFSAPSGVKRDVVHNANGLDVAVVEGSYAYLSTQGDTLDSRSKVIGFQANYHVILVQFIAPADSAADVLPATDQIIDTIQKLKP